MSVWGYKLYPRHPGSPYLRMVSWNLNTLGLGGDYRPLHHPLTESLDPDNGSVESQYNWVV